MTTTDAVAMLKYYIGLILSTETQGLLWREHFGKMALTKLIVRGARQHNLKNINLEIPRNSLTVITGLSGSGKSSLAFDTIYAEGQRRYVESLSAYARQFLDQMERPDVDVIEGLSPSIAIEQKTTTRSPRSTVGTITEIYDYLRVVYASVGVPHCPNCGKPITRQSSEQIVQAILHGVQVDLTRRDLAEAAAEALEAAIGINGVAVAPHFDAKTERYQVRIERTRHGNIRMSTIDTEFVHSGDYEQIRQTAEMLRGLIGAGAYVQRGDKKQLVRDFPEAMRWLLGEVEKSMTLQRYKGLGEMNPEQLWETTMDPGSRRLLRVQIDDGIAADEIFTKLMGDEVEPRRLFIESNALGVRNLDV